MKKQRTLILVLSILVLAFGMMCSNPMTTLKEKATQISQIEGTISEMAATLTAQVPALMTQVAAQATEISAQNTLVPTPSVQVPCANRKHYWQTVLPKRPYSTFANSCV